MIPEIGLFALILSFGFALLLVLLPTIGLVLKNQALIKLAPIYVIAQCTFIFIAFACLIISFLRDDFSVAYVLTNSSISLPWFYKLCAVWGGHEGSMLLWVVILNLWMLAVSRLSKHLDAEFRIRVLIILGALSAGFILFVIMTSNPFIRQFYILNSSGRDLNPLLQDLGFLFHPPILYMGYVGFSVAFAFAIAVLWIGNIATAWSQWLRPWVLAAWCCLTLGITLGSWWAYRELGWGGWWFWDPVENASFMPWLVGTALIHSLIVCEKRQLFKAWTLLLAITAFSLSLVGTFLVRSGVLTSVHTFAVDPERGLYILIFLFVVVGGSLLLFATRASAVLTTKGNGTFYPISRESMLFFNNLFLMVAMLTILLGTIYPLLIDGLGLGKLSVGAPYFNAVFIPIMIGLLLVMGVGVQINWYADRIKRLLAQLSWIAGWSILLPLCLLFTLTSKINGSVWLGVSLAAWIIISSGFLWFARIKNQKTLSASFYGMLIAHIGVAVTVIGISVSSGYGIQDDVKIEPGTTVKIAGFSLECVNESGLKGPNYHGSRVHFRLKRAGHQVDLYPEKRIYNVSNMAMTESAIDATLFRDIYVALGEPLDEKSWSVRIYYKPLIRWIWGGGLMMVAGGFLSLIDRRYYTQKSML